VPLRDHPDVDPAFHQAVLRTYVRPVDAARAARHVAALAAATGPAAEARTPRTAPRRAPLARLRAWRPVLAAGLAVLLLPAALAIGGVRLPSPVEAPYETVGIELPNQAPERPDPPAAAPATTESAPPATTTARPVAPAAGTPATAAERRAERRRRRAARRAAGADRRREDAPGLTGDTGRPGETPADRRRDDPPRSATGEANGGRGSQGSRGGDRSGDRSGSSRRRSTERSRRRGSRAPRTGVRRPGRSTEQTPPPPVTGDPTLPEQDGAATTPRSDDGDRRGGAVGE
jgi:hypothetical protein